MTLKMRSVPKGLTPTQDGLINMVSTDWRQKAVATFMEAANNARVRAACDKDGKLPRRDKRERRRCCAVILYTIE